MTHKRTERGCHTSISPWSPYLTHLSADQARWFTSRLDQLQRQAPKRGFALHARCMGVRSALVRGRVGSRFWGASMLRKRSYYTRQRSARPLISPNQRRAILRRLQLPVTDHERRLP